MATKVVMEALSPTMEEGRLVKWLKGEGDRVAKGDLLAEIETDKAIMELAARADGVLRARLVKEGETRPVGQIVAVIGEPNENIDAMVAEAAAAAPTVGPTAAPATPSAPAASTPTAPAAPPPPPPPPPSRSPTPPPGRPSLRPAPAAAVAATATAPAAPLAPAAEGNGGRLRSSPLARRLASERGLELGSVRGSGPGGRIIRRDVEAAPAGAAARAASVAAKPRLAIEGDYRDVPLTQIRKTIAKRLAESIGPIPTFYLTAEADVTSLVALRQDASALGDAPKISVNDLVMRATTVALVEHPEVNAHWLGDHIRYFSRVHLGMAVAVEDGLITPVIFDADSKRLRDIAAEARDLAARARQRRLTPAEYTGSTFSVSNLGMFGIDQFTAIINPPEVGILAVGAVEERPVVVDGAVAVRSRLRLTMSCDHRVVDGATGARFLQTLVRILAAPILLM
ncbi:MAG TPA: dihydrolipoamide acetyltransferase family protein [Gemmatimonadaceae bacterium]|nr:dihydrolipoamide acetyltransferase family protein [Gemmatimonadaceae bacterium]